MTNAIKLRGSGDHMDMRGWWTAESSVVVLDRAKEGGCDE